MKDDDKEDDEDDDDDDEDDGRTDGDEDLVNVIKTGRPIAFTTSRKS